MPPVGLRPPAGPSSQSGVVVVALAEGGPGDVRDSRLWRGAGCGGSGGGMEGAPIRRGRALGLVACSGTVLRGWATGGGTVGRAGAGRLAGKKAEGHGAGCGFGVD